MEPFLMIGLVHVLCPFQPEHRQIGEQYPVEETGVADADPQHQAESQQESLSECFCSRSKGAGRKDSRKDQNTEAFCQEHIFRSAAHVDLFVCPEVRLLYVRRVIVDACRAVFSAAPVIREMIAVKIAAKTSISVRMTRIFMFIPLSSH